MKIVQDYYYKKAKKEKYPARSVYKLEEAQQKFKFLRRGDKVLDLGCAPGSWSLYSAKIVGPQGYVIGVDLQKTNKVTFAQSAPIELIQANIIDPDFLAIVGHKMPFDVVVCDIAPRTTGHKYSDHLKSIELAKQALHIATLTLCHGGHFYCKVFQGEDFPEYVKEVRRYFKTTKVVKPKSSRIESREVFVLGMNYKKIKE